ncbi:DNA-directed RNA polymerase specialized sigma subunit, sigma24 family [Mucilaginibacter pineti]|uniref:DNA-directed RNA polymerase specialized sigma subunit, sigma24 family n=1 Tax=Mucilaginibacter pineti TaxID=1391627 RepID=A0A1G7L5Q9_9SPHI|nr:sigma-70 family RNA polymerase sigma factor [Mucilaginibacter pineti]SDF44369.1 DNA-directed RNA polymerase specialized sigma subunit, sigma24 family [Mucilaginibacter pineti]
MEIIKRDTPLPMISETDEDLLVIMSMKDDENACNSAFSEFHRRYKDLLYYMVGGVCSSHPNSRELTKVIFNNVMLNVYQYCHTFTCEGQTDPEKVKKSILSWLATIARNEYKAQFKKPEKRDAERSAFKTMVKSSLGKPQYSYSEDLIEKAYAQIPKERDRDILRTYWVFYEKGEKSQAKNLPDDVLDDLSVRYNTSRDNIRTIISRTNRIVKTFLETNYKQ